MLRSGTQLGPYRLEEPIGRGAHALVYRAHDPRLDNHVAIKVLADNHAVDPEASLRFTNEARALRLIRSNAVATVFDVGTSDEGQPFIVLEHADRGSLSERLEQRNEVAVSDIERLVEALTKAMVALHSAGLVHRDIKPANLLIRTGQERAGQPGLLLGADEELFLGDFGLAKNLDSGSGLTVGAGTAAYAAPEQGQRFGQVDERTDLHAATAVVVETILGRPQDDQTWSDLVRDRLGSQPLADQLLDGLAADPKDRPANAALWGDRLLQSLLKSGTAIAVNTSKPRWSWLGVVALAVSIALIGFVGWRFVSTDSSAPGSNEPESPLSDLLSAETDDEDTTFGLSFKGLSGKPGVAEELRSSSGQTVQSSEPGWATFHCLFSHMGQQEPLLPTNGATSPGHNTFFGNSEAASLSTGRSIADGGSSTCAGGTINRSSFWLSTLWDPATSQAVPIEEMRLIYTMAKQDVPVRDTIAAIPAGLSYTIGNRLATEPSQTPATIEWRCDGESASSVFIVDCPDDTNLFVTFRFPQCWDGNDDDIGVPSLLYSLSTEGCPASHPVLLPSLRVRVYYDLAGIDDSSRLRVASDPASAELGGLTVSGGYIHGWQEGDFQLMVDSCLKALNDCGFNLVAEGVSLPMPPG